MLDLGYVPKAIQPGPAKQLAFQEQGINDSLQFLAEVTFIMARLKHEQHVRRRI